METHETTWMTLDEAARRLLVSTRTLVRWVKAGHLPERRTPSGDYRFRADEVDALLERAS